MTATGTPSFLGNGGVSNQKNKMLNCNIYPGKPQLTSALCSTANLSPCTPTWSLPVGAPSAEGLSQQRHSVSIPNAKLRQNHLVNSLKTDPPVLLGGSCSSNNKENQFRECFSKLGDRLCPDGDACVGASSQVNSSRYKTELCHPFKENGTCKYGDKCQFAHGVRELRSLSRHPKYKTELCRTFHTIGICPYGPRCHFIHNAEERRRPPPLCAFNKMQRPRLQHSFSFAGFPSSGDSQDSPTSVTPPPLFSTKDVTGWQIKPITFSSQKLASLFGLSMGPSSLSEPQDLALPSLTTSCSPHVPSPPHSLSDQEGYQSSIGSQSSPESPLLDASCRLPIFSRLSISDD